MIYIYPYLGPFVESEGEYDREVEKIHNQLTRLIKYSVSIKDG